MAEDFTERGKPYSRFKDISVSERILNTVFLLTIGLGYIAALANLYYTHQGLDGKAGLSVEDVVISYHGANNQTRLGTAINGIMKSNLKFASDKDVILQWIQHGADEPEYNEKVAPILKRDCIICHTPSVNPSLPDLTQYKAVSEVAHAGGATIPTLVRVSHIHLFGIAFILFFIGKIFLLCDLNVYIKRIAVVIPFAAMLLDILSWFITKEISSFAYVVIFSGTLMGFLWDCKSFSVFTKCGFMRIKLIPINKTEFVTQVTRLIGGDNLPAGINNPFVVD